MALVLYFGADEKVPTILNQAFEAKKKETGEMSSVTSLRDEKKLKEALVAMVFDLMFFEQKSLPKNAADFLKTFKLQHPGVKSKMLLVGEETEPLKIMAHLETGWTDYIVLPPDRPLLLEKVTLYVSGSRSAERQVYSLRLNQPADIAKPGQIEELSEFDCKLRAGYQFPIGELAILYSKAFGENVTVTGTALGRCYKSEPHPGIDGAFLNIFNFVGVTPDLLTNIRNALRKSYVSSKSR